MTKKLTTELFLDRAMARHGNRFNYDNTIYINDKTKLEIICKDHGSFSTFPASHFRSDYGGCAICAGNFKSSKENFISKAKAFHGDKYDYSLVNYTSNDEYIRIICPIHGEFEQIPINHYRYGCIKCSGKDLKSKDDFILESSITHHKKYDYSLVDYHGMFCDVKIICPDHGEFSQLPTNHLHGRRGCPKCSKRISKTESMWLDSLGLPNDKLHRNVYIKIQDTKYFVDGYDSNNNTIYELNGDYWHGNLSIYNPEDIHPQIKIPFKELWNKTEIKRRNFLQAGYQVVSIWESEFLNSQKNYCKIIMHDHKYAQVLLSDEKIFSQLRVHLSFKINGVEYTEAYKNGWNGITYLMDKNGYVMSGLVPKIQSYLRSKNIFFSVLDKSISSPSNSEIDLSDELAKLNLIPRDYQTRIVSECLSHRKGIVRACTGSGKTLCTALITAKINKPTIIYVIGLDLLKQFHELFSSLFDEPIGFIGNGVCDIHRINIASIWSIGSALRIGHKVLLEDNEDEISPSQEQCNRIITMLSSTKLHIFDESHVITTDTIKQIYNKINPEYIYGFSGTPFRDDGSDLLINAILGDQIINVSASELISKGYLAQPIIKFVRIPKSTMPVGNQYQSVYKEYITDNYIRNKIIVENTRDLLTKNYQVLVLFKHLQHGENLKKIFDKENIEYEYLSGMDDLDTRIEVKIRLLSKKSNLVLASSIFDIGVDISSISGLVLAGGGKSSIKTLQRIGRAIRRGKENKKYCAIVDCFDDVKFLKDHSKKRYSIYRSEDGFKLIVSKNIPELRN